MQSTRAKDRRAIAAVVVLLAGWLPIAAAGEPTNGPLVALGLTNVPIGQATLEVIEGGILFVHDTAGTGSGVSVQLGEADSGVFLYPLTGYLYGGDVMEGKAYGRVNGATDQFISSVHGIHNGDSSGTVTVDFSALGASRLSIFAGAMLLGQVSNSTVAVRVRGDGYGCRANPWWRLPDGSFGALIELAQGASITFPDAEDGLSVQAASVFIRPDDPTNSVEFVSRVDVTSADIDSFCLTDARLGVFHQRHKALGRATLSPSAGQLVIGNLRSTVPPDEFVVSDIEDGVFVELANVSAFNVDLLPVDIANTNATVLISGYGTASSAPGTALAITRIDKADGFVQISTTLGLPTQSAEIQVLSNGFAIGSVIVSSNNAVVHLSGEPQITGCALFAKTMEALPGIAVRVDRETTFTLPGSQSFAGDEVRMLISEPVFFESIESFVMVATEVPSFTIIGESDAVTPAPELSIARSTNAVTISWADPNRAYSLEAAASLSDGFAAIEGEPVFSENHCRVTVSIQGDSFRFFRLRRHVPATD